MSLCFMFEALFTLVSRNATEIRYYCVVSVVGVLSVHITADGKYCCNRPRKG